MTRHFVSFTSFWAVSKMFTLRESGGGWREKGRGGGKRKRRRGGGKVVREKEEEVDGRERKCKREKRDEFEFKLLYKHTKHSS